MISTAGSPEFDVVYSLADGHDRASIDTMASRAFDRANEARAREPRFADRHLNVDRAGTVLTALSWAMILHHLDRTGEGVFDIGRFDEPPAARMYGLTGACRAVFGRSPFAFYPPRKPASRWVYRIASLLAWTAAINWAADRLPVSGTERFLIMMAATTVALAARAGVSALVLKWARSSGEADAAESDAGEPSEGVLVALYTDPSLRHRFECPECQSTVFTRHEAGFTCSGCGSRYPYAKKTA